MNQEKRKKIVLNIGGMSCVNCARAIEKQLSKLNGVIKATVNLAAEKAIIDYDPDIVDQKAIENAIVEAGYKVIHEKPGAELTGHLFDDVSALHTASCYSWRRIGGGGALLVNHDSDNFC